MFTWDITVTRKPAENENLIEIRPMHHEFESLPGFHYQTRAMSAITRTVVVMFFCIQVCLHKNKRVQVLCVCERFFFTLSYPPCGVSLRRPLPDTAPRREDKRAKEGPCLTAPANDSLQMLCRVTSANYNNPLKPPENVIQGTGPRPFPALIMRPQDKHLHRKERNTEMRRKKRGSLKFNPSVFVLRR